MTKPDSLPVEEVRKKIADVLDGTQHYGQHVEITRRGKRAGIVVPPEWYDRAVEALAAPPKVAPAPAPERRPAEPSPISRQSRPVVQSVGRGPVMSDARAVTLSALAYERADVQQRARLDQSAQSVSEAYRHFAVVAEAQAMGLITTAELHHVDDNEPESAPARPATEEG